MTDKRRKAFKGFNSDLTCRGFQYEVGKEYETGGPIVPCSKGFHACSNPLDVLGYYNDIFNHRYCEVEQSGTVVDDSDKSASSRIKIKAEIGSAGLFRAGVEYLKEITDPKKIESPDNNKGYYAKIGSSGDSAQISSSGYSAKIGSSGDSAQIESTGAYSVVCCAGADGMVKAKKGSWITLSEWRYDETIGRVIPTCVKTEYVDGERIKEDTWYRLTDGQFVEA